MQGEEKATSHHVPHHWWLWVCAVQSLVSGLWYWWYLLCTRFSLFWIVGPFGWKNQGPGIFWVSQVSDLLLVQGHVHVSLKDVPGCTAQPSQQERALAGDGKGWLPTRN